MRQSAPVEVEHPPASATAAVDEIEQTQVVPNVSSDDQSQETVPGELPNDDVERISSDTGLTPTEPEETPDEFNMEIPGLDSQDIPAYGDQNAPQFDKEEHHLSDNAIRCRARRIFTPRVDGSKKVSDTIYQEWHSKGKAKKDLQQIFKRCGYDPESFLNLIPSLIAFIQSFMFSQDFNLVRFPSLKHLL